MVWTAILESSSNADKVWEYTIVYTNGADKFRKYYRADNISDSLIESVARFEIARLTAVADAGKLSYQTGASISLVVAPPAATTPEQLAQAKFLSDYRQLQALLRAVDGGFIDAGDKRIVDLRTAINAAWLDSYVGLV